jgi:cytochrome c-type biogenesis protein CcmH/NrfF
MSAAPIAHAGHWLVNVLYIVPLVVVVLMLWISSIRDKRAEAAEAAAAPAPASDPAPDEFAAP